MGFRLRLLESSLRWARGERSRAWGLALEAHLCRLSLLSRWVVGLFLAWAKDREPRETLRWGRALLRLVPGTPHLRHFLARAALQQDQEVSWAWDLLVGTVSLAQEDPLLLEALMLMALERIQSSREHPVKLGHQDWSPQVPYVFEEALNILIHRHGESRSAWDRSAPAHHLLQTGRPLEALSLARSLPLTRRGSLLCEVEAMALHRLGDLQGAWSASEVALAEHPGSFRLWMERFHAALGLQNLPVAREALEMAGRLLPPDPSHPAVFEWRLHRAEFAHRVDQDSELAWTLLAELPDPLKERNAHLLAQILVGLGRYDEALSRTRALPTLDLDLCLLQAECMAGLGTWNTLVPFLEGLPAEVRERPAYWHFKGLAWAHLDDPPRARADLETAMHLAPRNLRIVLDAGHASAELGDHDRAEQHWRHALSLDENSEEALYQMACTRQARHDHEGARRFLRECLLHHPHCESAQAFLAELEAN